MVPSLFQSGHSSPASLFLGTLSQVQWPTAETTEGHDGKPRREGRWQGGQQSCLLSRCDIPDVFCLEERASPDFGGRWGKRCSLPPLPAASLKMDKWCDVTSIRVFLGDPLPRPLGADHFPVIDFPIIPNNSKAFLPFVLS